MIKWSINLFTWYSLSPPVDFSQLVASPISQSHAPGESELFRPDFFEEHKMYVPEMVLGLNSWFREHFYAFFNSELYMLVLKTEPYFLQIWGGLDGFKTPRFLAICSPATIMMTMTTRPSELVFQHDLARIKRDLSRSQVGEMAMERNSPTFSPPNLCLV